MVLEGIVISVYRDFLGNTTANDTLAIALTSIGKHCSKNYIGPRGSKYPNSRV